jgi:hypothetical protein
MNLEKYSKKKKGYGFIVVLFRHLPGETAENNGNPQSG